MRRLLPLLLLLLATRPAAAAFTFAGDVTACARDGQTVHLTLANARLDVQVLAANLVRFRYTQRDRFDDGASYAVVPQTWAAEPFQINDAPDACDLTTRNLRVHIAKHPCRVAIYDAAGRLLDEDEPAFGVAFDRGETRCFKRQLAGDRFYGLGEKTGGLDRNGREYVMWNSDTPAYGPDHDPLYVSIPFFMGVREGRAHGIFLDNPWRTTFNMGAGNDRLTWFGAADGDLDYYFIAGPDPKRILSTYTQLTGRMQMPPLWALGYQQCRWSYYPEARVREIAQGFRSRKIPCDALYLDIDYMDGYRVFTWDRARFPDPRRLIGNLDAQGFKVIPIVDPGVKADPNYAVAREGLARKAFATWPDGTPYRGEVWPSWAYFPDFTSPDARKWWAANVDTLLDVGVKGIWNDMNEPAVWGKTVPDVVRFADGDHRKIHNVFALGMARATHEAAWKERPFILTRAGFAGVQRYAAVWTGDNVSNEAHLRMACTMPQSMGLSGLPFVGSDVGGFDGSPSPALYVRWMQLGAFTPFFRGHSMKGTPSKEPWALGEDAEALCRQAIEMRYRLLPYLYTVFREAAETGVPIMRPMFLEFPNDPACYERDAQTQFMLGDALLVAPVLSEHERARRLYLPAGRWLDLDGGAVKGGRWITVDAPLDRIPVFQREGTVVPTRDVQQYVGEKPTREIALHAFGDRARGVIYDDDGSSFAYRNGAYRLTEVTVERGTMRLRVLHDGYPQQGRYRVKQ